MIAYRAHLVYFVPPPRQSTSTQDTVSSDHLDRFFPLVDRVPSFHSYPRFTASMTNRHVHTREKEPLERSLRPNLQNEETTI